VFTDSLTAYVRHYFMASFTRRQVCYIGWTLWKSRKRPWRHSVDGGSKNGACTV